MLQRKGHFVRKKRLQHCFFSLLRVSFTFPFLLFTRPYHTFFLHRLRPPSLSFQNKQRSGTRVIRLHISLFFMFLSFYLSLSFALNPPLLISHIFLLHSHFTSPFSFNTPPYRPRMTDRIHRL